MECTQGLECVPYAMLDGDSKSPDFGSGYIHGYLSQEACILVPDSSLKSHCAYEITSTCISIRTSLHLPL